MEQIKQLESRRKFPVPFSKKYALGMHQKIISIMSTFPSLDELLKSHPGSIKCKMLMPKVKLKESYDHAGVRQEVRLSTNGSCHP